MSRSYSALVLAAIVAASSTADAIPQVGSMFPAIGASDITGQQHHSRELLGHVTLMLVGSDSDTGDALRAWGSLADRRLPPTAQRLIVMALDLAVIIPTSLARSRARDQTPERFWHQSWFDISGSLRPAIGIPESEVPWVFVVDANGRIVASAHCFANVGAEQIWRALDNATRALESPPRTTAPAAP